MDYFGLDEVTLRPQNCIFTLNGEEHESRSNYITLNSTLSVSFHEVSDEPANISFRPSGAAILPTLKEFASTYNQLIDLAHSDSSNYGGKKLLYQTNSYFLNLMVSFVLCVLHKRLLLNLLLFEYCQK